MARPIESQLYSELIESGFRFIPRGTQEINDIYDKVKGAFGDLCDDDYPCLHHKKVSVHQTEWKHVVRNALQRCKIICDDIEYCGRRGYWMFS